MADEKVQAALSPGEAVIPSLLKDPWMLDREMKAIRDNIATFIMVGTDTSATSEMNKAAKNGVLEAISILRELQKKIG